MKTLRVQPRSGIESWGSWPNDVLEVLQDLNREHHLTFTRIGGRNEQRIFQCEGCQEWHEPPTNGVAVLYGNAHCDLCLISLARLVQRVLDGR